MTQLDRIELMLTQLLQEIQALKTARPGPSMQSHAVAPLVQVRGFLLPEAQAAQTHSWFPAPMCSSAPQAGQKESP